MYVSVLEGGLGVDGGWLPLPATILWPRVTCSVLHNVHMISQRLCFWIFHDQCLLGHSVCTKLRFIKMFCWYLPLQAVTVTYYQLMHTVRDPIPQQLHLLADASRSYVPGHQYKAYVAQKSASTKPNMEENLKPYYFIPYSSSVISGPLGLEHSRCVKRCGRQKNLNEWFLVSKSHGFQINV